MTERWAKPVIPLGTEEAGKSLVAAGRRWDIPTWILEPDDVERVRLGYVCIACLEQHDIPWVAACQLCGFPIKAIQPQVFEHLYEGDVKVGPGTTLAEEMEIAQEIVDRGVG